MINLHSVLAMARNVRLMGCVLVTITSIMIIFFYIEMNKNSKKPSDTTSCFSEENSLHHIELLAKDTPTYLKFLKILDKHTNISFPPHCRTIDFYLACRSSDIDDAESVPDNEEEESDINGLNEET